VIGALEDAEDYRDFAAAVIADYDAQSAVERTLCDQIQQQLEDIRDFFQSGGCSLAPTTFQVGNVTLSDVSLVRDVSLRLTAHLRSARSAFSVH
jgi:hypothetical protein